MRITLRNDDWKKWLKMPVDSKNCIWVFPAYLPDEDGWQVWKPQTDDWVVVPNDVYRNWFDKIYKI